MGVKLLEHPPHLQQKLIKCQKAEVEGIEPPRQLIADITVFKTDKLTQLRTSILRKIKESNLCTELTTTAD